MEAFRTLAFVLRSHPAQTGSSNGSKQTNGKKMVDALLFHGHENNSNLVPSLQHSLLLWTPPSQITSGR